MSVKKTEKGTKKFTIEEKLSVLREAKLNETMSSFFEDSVSIGADMPLTLCCNISNQNNMEPKFKTH